MAGTIGSGTIGGGTIGSPGALIPTTTITVGPGSSASNSAIFEFSADLVGTIFKARIDGGGWVEVESPLVLHDLDTGRHHLEIRGFYEGEGE